MRRTIMERQTREVLTREQSHLSQQVKFCQIAAVFREIEETRSRNEKQAIFSRML